jgi:hypothetical protein
VFVTWHDVRPRFLLSYSNRRRLTVAAIFISGSSARDVTEVTKSTEQRLEIINDGEDDGDN